MRFYRLAYLTALGLLLPLLGQGQRAPLAPADYRADFAFFWETVRDHYAYFPEKQTDWARVRQFYEPQLDTLTRRAAFVRLLENALAELYDPHATLGTNRPDSWRLVPSGSDLWLSFRAGQAVVGDVRRGSGAARVGIRPGMRVLAANGEAPAEALAPLLPRCLRAPDSAARRLALNQLLAGRHNQARVLRLQAPGEPAREFRPDDPVSWLENVRYPARVETARHGAIGYLRINDCLYDNALIADFDRALDTLADTQGLVLDLRETPSGGNSTVARAMMGRFVTGEQPYQKHELPEEQAATGIRRSWLELASPRPRPYRQPVVVLAGHWTGSMGEGLTIGLARLPQVRVLGTELAGLRGAVYSYTLPRSGFRFRLPVERLYEVSGRPRENFRPRYYRRPQPTDAPAADGALQAALRLLRQPQSR